MPNHNNDDDGIVREYEMNDCGLLGARPRPLKMSAELVRRYNEEQLMKQHNIDKQKTAIIITYKEDYYEL